jgi:hypothetical protein
MGIALLPEAIAEARQPSLGVTRLAEPEICWELVVAYLASEDADNSGPPDHAARAFLKLLNSDS